MIDAFVVNELYSHEEAYRSLGLGNAGGVRFLCGKDGNVLRGALFTAVPSARVASENPYFDRVEDGVLTYTAQGRKGDQGLGGMGARLIQQKADLFPIYCFQLICSRRDKSVGIKRWRFLGLLHYLRHRKERQVDIHGNLRQVFVFEFSIVSDFSLIICSDDRIVARHLYESNSKALQDNTDLYGSDTESAIKNIREQDSEKLESVRFKMLSLHPREFELLVKAVLEKSGFRHVCATKYSQDGGVDVEAMASDVIWPIRGQRLQVQAKRWMHSVGRKEVAELRGSLAPFAHGAIVTTSQFTKAAINEASEEGKRPIVAIDGYDFAAIVGNVGITI